MHRCNSKQAIVGNDGLSSEKENFIAIRLKERNLERVNMESAKVNPKSSIYTKYIKRILDCMIASCVFLIVSPINLALTIGTFFDVGSPIIFRQSRIGKDGKAFQIIKFRNMTNEKDKNGNLLPPEKRVTKFGKFVRKYSLDELMNFWSIIKGDMSIIGPRPLPVFFNDRYSERHKMRNAVRPGLECPRIIRNESVSRYHEQFENDIWYVENVSFFTDLKMIVELFRMTFNMKYRELGSGAASYFVGYDDKNNAISLKKAIEKYPELLEEYEV